MTMMSCRECGKEISDSALTCPNCGAPPKKASRFFGTALKVIGGFFVVMIALAAIFGRSEQKSIKNQSPSSQSSASERNSEPAKRILKTTSTELNQHYEQNEVATDEEIGDAVVEIAGVVSSIGKDFADDVVLQLKIDGETFSTAGMSLLESYRAEAATLRKGQKVTVQCAKVRFIMSSPYGSDCALMPAEFPGSK